jgi:hypothetical protein
MVFAFLLALSGLTLSAVAIYYSVIGLTAVFAAAFWPIVIMGTTLEVSKLVAASWLKAYWEKIPVSMKVYMTTAVVVLMVITSMGIFGFLSKAHLDQNIVSGDVQGKIAIYDEKIKTERENIDAARTALSQMDAQVNERLSRSTDDRGAERAVQIRRQQQAERTRLQNDISRSQGAIARLNEERAPIAAEVRKVEAEVGPIKYIAALIYGDNPDANLLEKAVTWVIMIIVFVFDPLAILMLLGAQMTYKWHREKMEGDSPRGTTEVINSEPPTVTPATVAANDDIDIVAEANAKIAEIEPEEPVWPTPSPYWPFPKSEKIEEISPRDLDLNEAAKEEKVDIVEQAGLEQWNRMIEEAERELQKEKVTETEFDIEEHARSYDVDQVDPVKTRMRQWKLENPDSTIKEERAKKDLGMIDTLPWEEEVDKLDKKTYIVKEGDQQVVKTRDDTYVQNAEQTSETLWQRIQDKKTK